MAGNRFNTSRWPTSGSHRALLDLFDQVHRQHGLRSLRTIGASMNLSYTRVHEIVRGDSLPADDRQAERLVLAIAGRRTPEVADAAERAVALFFAARADAAPPGTPPSAAAPTGGTPADAPPPGEAPASAPRSSARAGWSIALLGRRNGVRMLIALGLAVALGAAAVGVWGTMRPDDAAARMARVAGEVVFVDEFEGDDLDPNRWNRSPRPDVVGQRDGALDFVVTGDRTVDGLHTELMPRSIPVFSEVSLTVAVPSYTRAGPGGVALVVTEAGGRNHRLFFGPSEGGPEVAALVCDAAFCPEFDDYRPPAEFTGFEVGEQVPLRLTARGPRIEFYVRDRLVAQSGEFRGPLASLSLDVYGAESEAWRITVDSLRVSR